MENGGLVEKSFATGMGKIAYWVTRQVEPGRQWVVFLPGLTADHRLFEGQVEHFAQNMNVLVWDPPCHGASRHA